MQHRLLIVKPFQDRRVGAGGREDRVADADRRTGQGVFEAVLPAVHLLVRDGGRIGLGIGLGVILGKHQMARRRQSVGAHAGVVALFVIRLPVRRKPDDDVARRDAVAVDDVAALHADEEGGIDDQGGGKVAHVGRFAARHRDAHAVFPHFGRKAPVPLDHGLDGGAVHAVGVAVDGIRHHEAVQRPDAEQVVQIHDGRILRDIEERAVIPGLPEFDVGERGLRSGPVGVHGGAVSGIARRVFDQLAEGAAENPASEGLHRAVHFFFRGRNPSRHISIGHSIDSFPNRCRMMNNQSN